MNITYDINISQQEVKPLSKQNELPFNSSKLSTNIYIYNNIDGIRMKSNNTNISNGYAYTNQLLKDYKKVDNFIYGKVPLNNSYTYHGEIKDLFPIVDIKAFLNTYRSRLIPISDKIPNNIDLTKELNLMYYKDNTLNYISDNDYTIDKITRELITSVTDPIFLLESSEIYDFKRLVDYFDISLDKLASLDNGFYNIYPTTIPKSLVIEDYLEHSLITSTKPYFLSSNYYINFDNCITNNFLLLPNYSISVSYSDTDYTPLNELINFDIDKEYIIFKLVNKKYIPQIFVSKDVDDTNIDEFKLVLASHEEFKKDYAFIVNKATLSVVEGTTLITTKEILNEKFNILKNDTVLIDGLAKLKST